MPTTINGVGTKYYGRRKVRSYTAECESCHRVQELSDYETTYFFVVLYIPIIPLGKKQIFADCPRCRRHRVMPLAEWQKVEEQSLAQGAKSLGENPDDPHTALELLRSFSAFQRFDEAEKLAQGIETQYDDNAEVQTAIGHWHEYRNRPAEAAKCFRKAQQIEPENLPAKCGVVRSLLREGRTSEAQALMDAAPRVPAAADVGLYVDLGRVHQHEGNHPAAIAAFWAALEAAPKLGNDPAFRKLVRTSEKQVPGQRSMFTSWAPAQRWMMAGTIGVLILLGVAAYVNYYISTHRQVHVVNGFDIPLEVQIDERKPVTLQPHDRAIIPLAEGTHHALVSYQGNKLVDEPFEMHTDYVKRWFSNPAFIYNAGGGAPIAWEQITYAVKPVDDSTGHVNVQAGLVTFDHADYVFEEFPAQIELKNTNSAKRSRVGLVPIRPEQIVLLPTELISTEDKLTFLERHLKIDPGSKVLVQAYVSAAAFDQQLDRAKQFLTAGLDDLPLRVEWHRMVEQLSQSPAEKDALRERYRRLIERDPKNAAAMYLLGRLEPTAVSQKLFEQAIEIDPENFYPWQAQGYLQWTAGDFAASKASYERAVELNPDDVELEETLLDLSFALREYRQLEEEVRSDLNQDRTRLDRHVRLLQILVAKGELKEAQEANEEYIAAAEAAPDEFMPQASGTARALMHYLEQDFKALLEDADAFSEQGGVERLRYQAQLEMGRLDDAGENLQKVGGEPFELLELSTAWRMKGDAAASQRWFDMALEMLDDRDDETRHVAALLRKEAPPDIAEIQQIQIQPAEKTVLLIALAARQPAETRAELLSLAERLNYNLAANHWFRERAIKALRKPATN